MDQMDNSEKPEHRIDGRSDNMIISSNWITLYLILKKYLYVETARTMLTVYVLPLYCFVCKIIL